jgi:hypothetical protein
MFDRIISVDWSGAGNDSEGVDLRIAMFYAKTGHAQIVNRPYQNRTVASWSRQAFRGWITEQLRSDVPTLVAMDFGFGLPWGADHKIFGVDGWRPMIGRIAEIYTQHETARATAQFINDEGRFKGHGPYRFDSNRNDFRFYLDNSVGYYRLTELVAPQGISQWYLGSGGTVGFHTITGLSAINFLIKEREVGRLNFEVWPHEHIAPDGTKYVLVESYPAICPKLDDYGPCQPNDGNQKDAWRVLQMLIAARSEENLSDMFVINEIPFGRIANVPFVEQIQFEGFIMGLK